MANDDPLKSTYWPSLRESIKQDQANFQKMDLMCNICHIRLLPKLPGVDYPEDIEVCRGVVILPCGHMLGETCFVTWLESGADHCSFCEQTFYHPECQHILQPYPFTSASDAFDAPPTLREGSTIANKCLQCSYEPLADLIMDRINKHVSRRLPMILDLAHFLEGYAVLSKWDEDPEKEEYVTPLCIDLSKVATIMPNETEANSFVPYDGVRLVLNMWAKDWIIVLMVQEAIDHMEAAQEKAVRNHQTKFF